MMWQRIKVYATYSIHLHLHQKLPEEF